MFDKAAVHTAYGTVDLALGNTRPDSKAHAEGSGDAILESSPA